MSRPEVESRATALRAERVPFVHATVVLADRPTSAKPGDEAIVFADGTIEGFVGGTCAESTVRAQGLTLLDSGEPLLLRITPSPEDDEAWADAAEGARPDRLSVHNPCLSGGTLEIFLEPVVPAPLLVVHGDSPIAHALAQLGERLGYQVSPSVTTVPPDGGIPEPDLTAVPGAAAVVVASHGRDEEPVLEAALRADVTYVALVASRKRGETVVASLDVDEAGRARVHTPAGLDIGARTPEEVALSILAEIVSERRRTSGRPVSEEHHHHVGRVEHPDWHEGHVAHPDEHAGHLGRVEHPDSHGEHVGHWHTEPAQAHHGEHGHTGHEVRGDVAQSQGREEQGEAVLSHDHEPPGQQQADDAHHGHGAAEGTTTRPGTATDPVCGMTVATVEASLHLDHEGVRYWFCGTGCLRAFAADPARYLAS